jgi:hypothetical protein
LRLRGSFCGQSLALASGKLQLLARFLQFDLKVILDSAEAVQLKASLLRAAAQAVPLRSGGSKIVAQFFCFRAEPRGLLDGGGELLVASLQLQVSAVCAPGEHRQVAPGSNADSAGGTCRDHKRATTRWAIDAQTRRRLIDADFLLTLGAVEFDIGHGRKRKMERVPRGELSG